MSPDFEEADARMREKGRKRREKQYGHFLKGVCAMCLSPMFKLLRERKEKGERKREKKIYDMVKKARNSIENSGIMISFASTLPPRTCCSGGH